MTTCLARLALAAALVPLVPGRPLAALAADQTPAPITALAETIPAADLDFLRDLTREVVLESRVLPGKGVAGSPTNTCGFALIMPGGKGSYPAFWIRDFSMSLESGFITPAEMLAHLRLMARCQNGPAPRPLQHGLLIPPFAIPDHINFDGGPVFYPGTYSSGDDQGTGHYGIRPPVDDQYEFIHTAWCLHHVTRRTDFLDETVNGLTLWHRLQAAFETPDVQAETGMVTTQPPRRAVGFGFCDGICLTGDLLFPSLLRYRAAGELAELNLATRREDQAQACRQIQARITTNLARSFGEPARIRGWLLAATGTGRQPDVWGTLYALQLDALRGPSAERALETIAEAVRQRTILFEGAVRHVPTNFDWSATSAWEQTAGETLNTYQNGAYWHTPTGWLITALQRHEPALAAQIFGDYIRHLRANDFRRHEKPQAPWECFGPHGYSQNGIYMTSVTVPWASLRGPK